MAPYLIRYPLVPQEGSEGIKPESRVVLKRFILSRLFGLALILASYVPTLAGMFTWSNIPIVGEDPLFLPSGMAVFEISGGNILTLTLPNESPQILATGEALSGLTWDITDAGVTLFPDKALIAPGSELVGAGATNDRIYPPNGPSRTKFRLAEDWDLLASVRWVISILAPILLVQGTGSILLPTFSVPQLAVH